MLHYLGNSFRPLVDGAPVARNECGGVRASRKGWIAGDRDSLICTSRDRPFSVQVRSGSKLQIQLFSYHRMWPGKKNHYLENNLALI